MATVEQDFLEALGVAGQVINIVTEFEAGQPVTASPTVAGKKVNIGLVELPQGPVAPYEALTGNTWQKAFEAFTMAEGYVMGQPISLAVSVNTKEYGLTISEPVASATTASTVITAPPEHT